MSASDTMGSFSPSCRERTIKGVFIITTHENHLYPLYINFLVVFMKSDGCSSQQGGFRRYKQRTQCTTLDVLPQSAIVPSLVILILYLTNYTLAYKPYPHSSLAPTSKFHPFLEPTNHRYTIIRWSGRARERLAYEQANENTLNEREKKREGKGYFGTIT